MEVRKSKLEYVEQALLQKDLPLYIYFFIITDCAEYTDSL
jgi:hypothetical protein